MKPTTRRPWRSATPAPVPPSEAATTTRRRNDRTLRERDAYGRARVPPGLAICVEVSTPGSDTAAPSLGSKWAGATGSGPRRTPLRQVHLRRSIDAGEVGLLHP